MIKMKGDGGSKPCRPPRPPGNTFCPRPFLDVKHGAGRFLRGSEEPLWPLDGKYGCETRTMDRADGVVVQLAAWRTLRQIARPIAYTVQHVHHRGSCQSHNAFPMVLPRRGSPYRPVFHQRHSDINAHCVHCRPRPISLITQTPTAVWSMRILFVHKA